VKVHLLVNCAVIVTLLLYFYSNGTARRARVVVAHRFQADTQSGRYGASSHCFSLHLMKAATLLKVAAKITYPWGGVCCCYLVLFAQRTKASAIDAA
jgi:hypothetical protein